MTRLSPRRVPFTFATALAITVALSLALAGLVPTAALADGPAITAISPTSSAPCGTVTITGTGFGATQGTSKVTFSGAEASIVSWSETAIKATVPRSAVSEMPPSFTQAEVVVTVGSVASNHVGFGVSVDKWSGYLSVERLSATRQRITAHLTDLCGQPGSGQEIDWVLTGVGTIALADSSGALLSEKTATTVSSQVLNEGQSWVEVEVAAAGWSLLEARFIQDEYSRSVTLQQGSGSPPTSYTPGPTYTWPTSASSVIAGLVYNDLDNDGRFDKGKEWGIPQVQVDLVLPNMRFTTYSQPDGAFQFVALTAGIFDIEVNPKAVPGFEMTSPAVLRGIKVSGRSKSLYNYFGYHTGTGAASTTAAAASGGLSTGRAPEVKGNPEFKYFPATGHNLAYGFRHYWEAHGGLAIFGNPITEEGKEGGRAVQYFERARFEYFPEHKGTPYEVQLGLIGTELTQGKRTFAVATAQASTDARLYFAQTRHSLSGAFLDFWRQHGGLASFGYPISEEFQEQGKTVQYFERARFEVSTGGGSPPQVQLGLLGTELLGQRTGAP